MRILIDIVHPADVNFYKGAIEELRKGHEVVISVMDRGNLPAFVGQYLGKCAIIGKHSTGGFFSKAAANVSRVLALRSFIRKMKPDVVTSFSYYPGAATFFLKVPSVIFHDDPE